MIVNNFQHVYEILEKILDNTTAICVGLGVLAICVILFLIWILIPSQKETQRVQLERVQLKEDIKDAIKEAIRDESQNETKF